MTTPSRSMGSKLDFIHLSQFASQLIGNNTLCILHPLGLDDTIERRHGDQSPAKGIYRDPVRSSQPILSKSVACAGSRVEC